MNTKSENTTEGGPVSNSSSTDLLEPNRFTFKIGEKFPMRGNKIGWFSTIEKARESARSWGAKTVVTLARKADGRGWKVIAEETLHP